MKYKIQKYKILYQHVLLHVLAGEWQGDSVTYDPIQALTARETPPVETLACTTIHDNMKIQNKTKNVQIQNKQIQIEVFEAKMSFFSRQEKER